MSEIEKLDCLPALAKSIAEWFPELGDRAIPVTDADLTKENMPKQPFVFVMMAEIKSNDDAKARNLIEFQEEFIIEFFYETQKHRRDDGSETALWARHDYKKLLHRFVSKLKLWKSPEGGRIQFVSARTVPDEETGSFVLSLKVNHLYNFCEPDEEPEEPIYLGQVKTDIKMTQDNCKCVTPKPNCNNCK